MTSFDFDVIGDTPPKPLPNVQKPPAEKPADKPSANVGVQPEAGKERDRAA